MTTWNQYRNRICLPKEIGQIGISDFSMPSFATLGDRQSRDLFWGVFGKYLLFGQVIRDIREAVEGWFLVDEDLVLELELLFRVEQPDRHEIAPVLFEQVEEMTAALRTEPALCPF